MWVPVGDVPGTASPNVVWQALPQVHFTLFVFDADIILFALSSVLMAKQGKGRDGLEPRVCPLDPCFCTCLSI